jgi:hypothetical protein
VAVFFKLFLTGTCRDANICYATIANGKTFDVLAHLDNGTNGFMAWDEL